MIIGLTGTNGSGKGEVVDYLTLQKRLLHFSVSNHLEKLLSQDKNLQTRKDLTLGAYELRKNNRDPAFLVRDLYQGILDEGYNVEYGLIIESIRNPAEIDFLRREAPGNTFFAFVDAPLEERYRRIKSRGTYKDDVSWDDFLKSHEREMDSGDPYGLKVKDCKDKSDFKIDTDCSLGEVYAQAGMFFDYVKNRAKGSS